MKSINRSTLAALLLGFLTAGAGAGLAQESTKEHSCCSARSCCSKCYTGNPSQSEASNSSYMSHWFKAKFGRDYPGTKPPVQTESAHRCC
jgi:hypothetical protein